MGMAGPHLTVAGAVFADRIIVQPLTDNISFIPRPNMKGRTPLDDTAYRVARLWHCLKVCLEELDHYYADLLKTISPPAPRTTAGTVGGLPRSSTGADRVIRPPDLIGPHFIRFHYEGQFWSLNYTERLERQHSFKSVFIAEASIAAEVGNRAKTKVVVKFAYNYNQDAHKLLVDITPSHAPRLLHCAYEPDVNMWVVVMDYIDGQYMRDHKITNPEHVKSFRSALKSLHSRGLVHGDLREPNILLVREQVMLVDFDWCGPDDVARYPTDINTKSGIPWAYGVGPGLRLRKAHDEFQFKRLTEQDL
jgi:serine/threonine protein kinase